MEEHAALHCHGHRPNEPGECKPPIAALRAPLCLPPALQAQRVLGILLQHGALDEESIAFLWQLTEGGWRWMAVAVGAA